MSSPTSQILVVDDEPSLRQLLLHYLTHQGYAVRGVGSVPEAVEALQERRWDLVITDLQLPGPSGLELLEHIQAHAQGTRMILMSGHADVPTAAAAIERGIDQLLVKPFSLRDLQARVGSSLARRRLEQERDSLEVRLRQRETESRSWILQAAHALIAAVEAKDEYTAGHASRVSAYSLVIATEFEELDQARFRLAGELHDVGKIGVPDAVLNKPNALTPEEWEQVRRHPEIGERILGPLIEDPLVMGVVRSHHEAWDGRGYPDGLQGEAIPFAARVLAVADTVDAMTSQRAYREPLGWDVAVSEVHGRSGTQFDPEVVAAFTRVLPALEALHADFANAVGKRG